MRKLAKILWVVFLVGVCFSTIQEEMFRLQTKDYSNIHLTDIKAEQKLDENTIKQYLQKTTANFELYDYYLMTISVENSTAVGDYFFPEYTVSTSDKYSCNMYNIDTMSDGQLTYHSYYLPAKEKITLKMVLQVPKGCKEVMSRKDSSVKTTLK